MEVRVSLCHSKQVALLFRPIFGAHEELQILIQAT